MAQRSPFALATIACAAIALAGCNMMGSSNKNAAASAARGVPLGATLSGRDEVPPANSRFADWKALRAARVGEAIAELNQLKLPVFVVSNQPGIAKGKFIRKRLSQNIAAIVIAGNPSLGSSCGPRRNGK